MSHAARCLHCNHDLSNASPNGAGALLCPGCGAEQARVAAARVPGPPPRPVRPVAAGQAAPPAPPARPAPARSPLAEPVAAAVATPVAAPPAAPSEPFNPFLDLASAPQAAPFESSPLAAPASAPWGSAPEQPRATAAVAQAAQPLQPQTFQTPQGRPLQAQPGAVAPQLRDPHAEFRKGRWQRPALYVALGAGALAALFFLTPAQKPAEVAAAPATQGRVQGAIGASLPPERIVAEDTELTEHKERFEERAAAENTAAAPASRPEGIAREDEFSRAFKAAAAH